MAKHEPSAADKPSRTLAPDLAAGVDIMIRQSVETLYASTDLAFEDCLRRATQLAADGIISKSEGRSGLGPKSNPTSLPKGTKVWVRRPIGGDLGYAGRTFDRGQVFELLGLHGDDVLVRLGYVEAVKPGVRLETCGTCGAQFLEASSAAAHHTRRHAPKVERVPVLDRLPGETKQEFERRQVDWRAQIIAQEAAADDRSEREESARAPLFLENSTASRQ